WRGPLPLPHHPAEGVSHSDGRAVRRAGPRPGPPSVSAGPPALHAHQGGLQDARHAGLRRRRRHDRCGCRLRGDAAALGALRARRRRRLEARLRLRDAAGRSPHPARPHPMSAIPFAPAARLDGRGAVIAGGLGAIGRATALRLAALGAHVTILHRREEEEASRFLATLPGTGHFAVKASITESASLSAAASQVKAKVDAVHILVNTAGFTKPVPVNDMDALDDQLIDAIFASNWRGVFATIRAFRKLLDATGDGLVVNVSSVAAFTGNGSNLAY